MVRSPEPLGSRHHRLLVALVARDAPSLVPLATDAVNQRWLTDEETAALSKVALDEFCGHLSPGEANRTDRALLPTTSWGLLEKQRRAFWD